MRVFVLSTYQSDRFFLHGDYFLKFCGIGVSPYFAAVVKVRVENSAVYGSQCFDVYKFLQTGT